MKYLYLTFISGSLIFLLTGCALGELGAMSARERIDYLKSIKPYGAHWIKEGMSRESRRSDLNSCGSLNGEEVEFSQDQINNEKIPSEPNGVNAYLRLRDKVGLCMQKKGYQSVGDLKFLGGCDDRCLYP